MLGGCSRLPPRAGAPVPRCARPLVVQYREWKQEDLEAWGWYGVVDHVARFETSTGDVGFGLHEHGFFGPFPKYGLERSDDGAPG